MPKKPYAQPTPPQCGQSSLGLSPAILAKRDASVKETWCTLANPLTTRVDYDHWCDPDQPKTVIYKDVVRAHRIIQDKIQATPLMVSKCRGPFDVELYFKLETIHKTGSFHERSAIYALHMLSNEQRNGGVFTASLGNWGMALASIGHKMNIKITVVVPLNTPLNSIRKCQMYGAKVVVCGKTLTEASLEAFSMIKSIGTGTYINGYDHPHVIAGAGSIGLEILEQLPDADAILVPVGGGGLIAGIATTVKTLKPDVLIYGVESYKNCCFFKALDNERPYKTECNNSLLGVPTAGYNAFHTARSLIDKMVLVRDDWICQAVLRLAEEERYIVEAAGAAPLAAILADPIVIPELREKKVICILSGANVDSLLLPRLLEYGLAVEGRFVSVKMAFPADDTEESSKVFKIIANIGCNIIHYDSDRVWCTAEDLYKTYITMTCETRGLQHSCTFKRVLERLFPDMCEFSDEPFCVKTKCPCFPKMWPTL